MLRKKKSTSIDYEKWIDEERKIYADDYTDEKKYSNKLIAFLDVLGIKDLIKEKTDGNEHEAIDIIENMRRIVETTSKSLMDVNKIDILHISDSFVFVSEPTFLKDLIRILASIQMRIIYECRYLLRGAVTIGDAIIREEGKYIIGPAYIHAFILQEKDAIYPRIIIDNNVANEIKNSPDFSKYIRIDNDKESFLDYISIYMDNEKTKPEKIKLLLRREGVFEHIQKEYDKFDKEENHNIRQKYGWTIQYYKEKEVWENAK